MNASLNNQRGGVYLMALIISSAIGGTYFYVTKHFNSKLSLAADHLAAEHLNNMQRELTLTLSNPEICMATLGNNYKIDPQTIKDEYEAPEIREDRHEVVQTGEPINLDNIVLLPLDYNNYNQTESSPPTPKFESYGNLKVSDIQLVFPSPLAAGDQMAPVSLYVTVTQWEKGSLKKMYPPLEQKVLLNLKKQGGRFVVKNCLPEKPLEMLPENQFPFDAKKSSDYVDFIKNGDRDTFKLCVISGFTFKPDNNSMSLRLGQRGEIAAPVQSQCRLIPVDQAGNMIYPANITHPVRWMIYMKADDDMQIFGDLTIQEFYSDSHCEAKCF